MWLENMGTALEQLTPGFTIWGISIMLLLQGFTWHKKKDTRRLGRFVFASGCAMFLVGLAGVTAAVWKLKGSIGVLLLVIIVELGLVIGMGLFSGKQLKVR
jgi:hypothetical protein